MSFKNLNLSEEILKSIEKSGYHTATPIQEQAIPIVLEGRDLRASAQTGTGKTAAFTLPTLEILSRPAKKKGFGPRALILVPTRELAMQVAEATKNYSICMPKMKTVCVYGGESYIIQNRQLSKPYEILVATPGRLIDHIDRGRIDLSRVEIFILDEADRMLDMGFVDDVEKIAALVSADVQTLMFSATFKGEILKLSKRLLKDPADISIMSETGKHENIEQFLYFVDNLPHKMKLLDRLLEDETMNQTLIFTSTKAFADELVDKLRDLGHKAEALHGDMNQQRRTRTMKRLRDGFIRFLVATDIAARGIDVQTITHVINFDLPSNAEDYVHRIGRTGRADAKGKAVSFAAPKDNILLKRIEEFTGQKITTSVIAGLEPKIKERAPAFKKSSPKQNYRAKPRSQQGRYKEKRPVRQ